jgi:hypothetical protein
MNFSGYGLVPTYVYRLFHDEELLYIGIAENVLSRMKQHEATEFWWTDVNSLAFSEFPSRQSAEAAEKLAIRCELPAHNIMHQPSDDSALEMLLAWDADLCTYIDGGAPSMEKHWKNRIGETYCRTVHSRAIDMDIRRFVMRNWKTVAFRSRRAYELLLNEAMSYATDPCDPQCACAPALELVTEENPF